MKDVIEMRSDFQEFYYKVLYTIRNRIVCEFTHNGKSNLIYKSQRHLKKGVGMHNNNNYFAARPNPGAGIGHQIANWNAGYWYASVFGLKFAHMPFCSSHIPFNASQWEDFLGFGEGEVSFQELQKKGSKVVRLPKFDGTKQSEIEYIQLIIDSYSEDGIIFLAEQDQFYYEQFGTMESLQKKFFNAPKRTNNELIYDNKAFNIAIHVRRGDIVQKPEENNPNLSMRYQTNDYFVNALKTALEYLSDRENIQIYLFSQGKQEDYPEFAQFSNLHFCLEMGAQESFLHMVYADALITSKSSFSYKPALLNRGIKFVPANFWHAYPNEKSWVLLDEEGEII